MAVDIIKNPFPGLRAFGEEESILFFGRRKQVDELLKKLGSERFLAVIGSSGSGKSSLVKSGLIPSLHKGMMAGSGSKWNVFIFRQGNDPIGNMAETLGASEKLLRSNSSGLINFYKSICKDSNLLVVVDQFEELFRFTSGNDPEEENDASILVNLLLTATEQKELPIYVVFTMRSDFLGECTAFPGLPERINEGQYLVPRMSKDELQEAVTGPVSTAGASISKSLVNQLIADVGNNPDQLPIFQHALMRTWDFWKKKYENTKPGEIGMEEYTAIGTMQHALSQHAEEAYEELDTPRKKQICELVFKGLTDVGTNSRGTRRSRNLADLCELTNASEAEVIEVINIFRKKDRGFLMPPDATELTSESIIDISHESIMRVWDRLIHWVDEENQSAQTYLRLCDAANLYEAGKGGLLRDPELQVAWKWKEENAVNAAWAVRYNNLFDKAMLFLRHSKTQFEKELIFKETMQKQRLRRARRIAVVISVIALGAFVLSIYAFELRNLAARQTFLAEKESEEAKRQRKIAVTQEQLAQKSRAIALENEKQALLQKSIAQHEQENAQKSEKNAVLQKVIAEQQKSYAERQKIIAEENAGIAKKQQSIAETQTEKAISNEKIAVEQRQISARLKDLAEARNMAYDAMLLINDRKFEDSRNQAMEAYKLNSSNNGPLLNNDIYSAMHFNWINSIHNKNQFAFHKYPVRSITGAGNLLLSVDESGMLCLSKPVDGALEAVASYDSKDRARSVTSSPDGSKAVLVSAEGDVILFDLSGGNIKETGKANFAGVGKQGRFRNNSELVVLSTTGLNFYRVGSGLEALNVIPLAAVNAIDYGRNGRVYIASGSKIAVYNNQEDIPSKPSATFTLSSRITSISADPFDRYLAAGTYDGGVWIKELGNSKIPVSFTPHASAVNNLEFSAGSGAMLQLATASSDQTIKLMDVKALASGKSTQDIITLRGHSKWVYTLLYSADGKYLYTGSEDKKIIGWQSTMAGLYQSLTAGKN